MTTIIALILSLFIPDSDADALVRTAPTYLTRATARGHLAAARAVELRTGIDADLQLSLAWHESRYVSNVVSHEPGGLVSCGVMTPVPGASCSAASLAEQYLAGAAHLRGWFDAAHGDERAALLGYAGGYVMIRACAAGPVLRATGAHDDLCHVVAVFQWRAAWIKRERSRGAPTS